MDSFESQIITAIKKIRNSNKQPDAEKILRAITKDSGSKLTLDDIQQKLHNMQSSSNLRNIPYQDLDSFNIVQSDRGDVIASSDDILGTFCDKADIDSDIDLVVSVRTSAIVRNKTADSSNDLSQNNYI